MRASLVGLALVAALSCRKGALDAGVESTGEAGVVSARGAEAGSTRPRAAVGDRIRLRDAGSARAVGTGADADAGRAAARIVALSGAFQPVVREGRRPCKVLRVRRAGTDTSSRPLYVATADLGFVSAEDPVADTPEGGKHDDPPPPQLSFTDTADVSEPAMLGAGCHRYEFWLVVGGRAPRATQLLYESCNDGYGAAGIGYDSVEVRDREVEIARSGGSNWRWASTWTVGLDPVRVHSTEGTGTFAGGWHQEEETWSWDEFRGSVRWSAPTCDPSGNSPDPEEHWDDDADLVGPEHRYVSVPQVTLDPEFERAGWRTTRLEGCAAHVDSTGNRGFVTYGSAGPAEDASFAVVASRDGVLFLEIHDDRWTGPTDRWVADDHVELWLAPEPLTYMSACIPRSDDAPPKQWAIRAADGRLFAGFGHPALTDLAVERAAGDGVVRMRVSLPHDAAAITIVYSDGDDGVHQKRLIATSALGFGDRATLGELQAFSAGEGLCTVQGGALRPVTASRRLERARAVVGRDD